MKSLAKAFIKNRKSIFIIFTLLFWTLVIVLKQGGQSLLIHYAWPFIVGGSFVFLFEKKWLKNKPGIKELLLLLTLAFFLITFLFDLSPSNGSLELMNISGGLLLALTLHQSKWEEKDLKNLFIGFIAVVCLLNIWGIVMYLTGHPFDRLVGPLIKPNELFAGYPNLLANLNILAVIPTIYLQQKSKTKKGVFFFCLGCIILFTGLMLTFSRAAWLSALFGGIAVIFIVSKLNHRLIRLMLAFAVSVVLVFGANAIRDNSQQIQSLQDKITFQSEDQGSSITERIASIQRGLEMALSSPLTGVGAGSFNYISQSYEEDFNTLSSYPYSLPVKIMAEHGFVVFLLMLVWLALVVIDSFGSKKDIFTVAGITALSLIIHHSVDNNLDFFAASFPLFILIGIIWPQQKIKKSLIKNNVILGIIVVLSLSGIIFSLHEAWYGRYYIQGRDAAGALNHQQAFDSYGKALGLFFPRDAALAQSYSALELYKENNEIFWVENATDTANEYYVNNNPIDYQGPLQLAVLSYEQNNYSNCLVYAEKTILLGGDNNFKADFYKLQCLYATGDKENLNNFIDHLESKLNKYFDLLVLNAHMTVLTDNPRYAIYILEELAKQDYDRFQSLYEKMFTSAQEEYKKFHTRYGIDAEIDFLGGAKGIRTLDLLGASEAL